MRGKSFSPSAQGVEAKTVGRIEAHAERLKNVTVHGGDYLKVVKQYDGPDTVFFLDTEGRVGGVARAGERA